MWTEKLTSLYAFQGRRLNKRRIITIFSVFIALIIILMFSAKFNLTAFVVKENQPQACISDCSFEGKICENDKIFECVPNEEGCKYKTEVDICQEGDVCSTIIKGGCYTPQTCDDEFHICVSDSSYKICEDGRTVEDSEIEKCPEDMVCNKNPNLLAICVAKK